MSQSKIIFLLWLLKGFGIVLMIGTLLILLIIMLVKIIPKICYRGKHAKRVSKNK